MGYITTDGQTITVDAILTTKGRELLARGRDEFRVTQFALSDDEIDYNLWDETAAEDLKGKYIESLPLIEALPNETNALLYKLVSLPKNTVRIPTISVGQDSLIFTATGQKITITPTTINYIDGNKTYGYTAILLDSRVATLQAAIPVTAGTATTQHNYISDIDGAYSTQIAGHSFNLIAKTQLSDITTKVLIIGNETGGRVEVNITVKKTEVSTHQ